MTWAEAKRMYPELSSVTDQNEYESLLGALDGQPAGVREEWFKGHREGCTAAWCTPEQLAQIHAAQRGTGSTEATKTRWGTRQITSANGNTSIYYTPDAQA